MYKAIIGAMVLIGMFFIPLLVLFLSACSPNKEELCESAERALYEHAKCVETGTCNPSVATSIKWSAAQMHVQTCDS